MAEGVIHVYAPETLDGGEGLLAIVVRASFRYDGVTFFTGSDNPQQLAFMCRGAGEKVAPHVHLPRVRAVERTQETLFIRSGRVQLTLYTSDREKVATVVLSDGDCVALVSGGHSLEMLTDVEMFEVKQGPYYGKSRDKVEFDDVD